MIGKRKINRAIIVPTCSVMTMALALLAISCPSSSYVNSLAFDVSSKSSFTASFNTRTLYHSRYETSITENQHQQRHCPSKNELTMKVSSGNKKSRNAKSSRLIELNNERLQTAGRPGSKKFMDPNKVFLGNLPYDATEEDVYALFAKHWNLSSENVGDRIESVKIIRDWKSGQSKGYGFIQFYEPMVATSAMESVNKGTGQGMGGWKIKGRRIRLDQGKRRPGEDDYSDEKSRKKRQKLRKEMEDAKELVTVKDLDEEGKVIHAALQDAEGAAEEEDDEEDGYEMSEDDMITFMEKGGLRGVMPLTEETAGFLGIEGLYDDDNEGFDEVDESYFEEYYGANGYSDDDFGDDAETASKDGKDGGEGDNDDDEELVYDGVFEEEYNPNEYEGLTDDEESAMEKMNREQRRAADKKRKKRKLPFKGFGAKS